MSRHDPEVMWELLLLSIEKGEVIPILGRDLLTIERGGEEVHLYEDVATSLAGRLGVTLNGAGPPTVQDVAARYVRDNPDPDSLEFVYAALRLVIEGLETPTPVSLRQLAEIRPLRLFVTTACDRWLERALVEVRGGSVQSYAYAPGEKDNDLPEHAVKGGPPAVYHLLGDVEGPGYPAATEEDMLEFMYSLESSDRPPQNLLDALHGHQLMLIGCSFPDWVTRLLVRIAKGKRLAAPLSKKHLLAGGTVEHDRVLTDFLSLFSRQTEINEFGASQFVAELYTRWVKRHPDGGTNGERPHLDPTPPEVANAVFISYASEDRSDAERLRDALRDLGLKVWFDQEQLTQGDRWDEKIRRNVWNCSLFVPLISKHVRTKEPRYFRLEWDEAFKRQPAEHPDVPFILPVRLDETPQDDDAIRLAMRDLQWAEEGDFLAQVVPIYQGKQRAEQGVSS